MRRHRRKIPRYKKAITPRTTHGGKWNPDMCAEEDYVSKMAWMPKGAIAADQTKLNVGAYLTCTSIHEIRFWYEVLKFTCADCGTVELWTAAQQQWWYEVAGELVASRAIRCRACREALKDAHGGTPRRSHGDRKSDGSP